MIIISDYSDLLITVLSHINSKKNGLIAIDGKDGSGKSRIADRLCSDGQFYHINLDDSRYLDKHHGEYIKYINKSILLMDIQDDTDKIIILDGICILDLLSEINRVPDLHIYVKKIDKN